jgi:O-antigen/teichoic acid export membrane protein
VERILARGLAILGSGDDRLSLQRDVLLAFGVRVASAAILYLSQVLLARWMGSFEYGIFVLVWTWVLILGGMSTLGLSAAMMQLLPAHRERGELGRMHGLLLGGRLIGVGFGTVVALTGMLGLAVWGSLLESHFLLPAFLALVCVPLVTLTDLQDGIGRANGWIGAALLPPYVLRPVLVLASMAGALASGLPASAATAAACAIAATWASGFVQTALLQRRIGATFALAKRDYRPRRWFRTSIPLLAFGASELLLQNVDVLVISRHLSPADVAVYFAAAKTMGLVLFVHYAVGSVLANRFSSLNARKDRAGLGRCIRDAVNWTFWPSLAAALMLLTLGRPLLWLFGPQFSAGYPVMFVLAIGFLARAATGPCEMMLNMLGEQRISAAVLGATALAALLLNLMLVPRFGLMGAAAANAAALAGGSALNAFVAWYRLGIEVAVWRLWSDRPATG